MAFTKTGKIWNQSYIDFIESDKCEACEKCVIFCPKKVISIEFFENKLAACITKEDNCIGCGRCASVCPLHCIHKK